ncbi:short-chain dehydrogenase [Paenibacillus cisolokensis]|jgi:NAD(P)-dependent dehydrogenase (short-subunit alcohol dehydrogenase family)|uniref:Short-chain dehydrogenase n=1 Tax=Paenibacillus cisolokensis TaxID=1658519 RepID=A0ABQ4NFA4_9BACL|nr:glucose 1-dehydrogenase [Paenibacillus cisolokensis]GIQ66879.1 short-chain dehydrogenase [Paenibacillus cisolokensis]
MDVTGKVALVTGAGKGIGKASAIRLAQYGAKVAVAGIGPDDLKDTATEIARLGGEAIAIEMDVTREDQVKQAVYKVAERYGGIDILVNCAGIQRYGTVVETSEELWDEVLNTNLKGVFLTSKHVIPEMRKRQGGSIVNISSIQAFVTQKQVAAYTASKGAINALTRAMAVDHADENIRVNVICPASVDTPMLRWAADLFSDDVEGTVRSWGRMHPIGRVARPEEIADAVVFLASSASSFMTGSELKVDGGLSSAAAVALPE